MNSSRKTLSPPTNSSPPNQDMPLPTSKPNTLSLYKFELEFRCNFQFINYTIIYSIQWSQFAHDFVGYPGEKRVVLVYTWGGSWFNAPWMGVFTLCMPLYI